MDLNEKLAQRRKEREQKYISEKIHDISNKKSGLPFSCRIPDDCIDSKRYPLFMAREVMRQLIDNLCVTTAVHPGALS